MLFFSPSSATYELVVVVFGTVCLGLTTVKISVEFHYLAMVKFNFSIKQLMTTQKSTNKQPKNKDFSFIQVQYHLDYNFMLMYIDLLMQVIKTKKYFWCNRIVIKTFLWLCCFTWLTCLLVFESNKVCWIISLAWFNVMIVNWKLILMLWLYCPWSLITEASQTNAIWLE